MRRICIFNPKGYIARSAISCRRPQRFSTTAVSIQSEQGRVNGGYIVTCMTDSDCRDVCPSHWLSGQSYVCQRSWRLYDYMMTYEHADPTFNSTYNALGKLAYGQFDPPANAPGICVSPFAS